MKTPPIRFYDGEGKFIRETRVECDVSDANALELVFHYWNPEVEIDRRFGGVRKSSSADRTLAQVPFGFSVASPAELPEAIEVRLVGYMHHD